MAHHFLQAGYGAFKCWKDNPVDPKYRSEQEEDCCEFLYPYSEEEESLFLDDRVFWLGIQQRAYESPFSETLDPITAQTNALDMSPEPLTYDISAEPQIVDPFHQLNFCSAAENEQPSMIQEAESDKCEEEAGDEDEEEQALSMPDHCWTVVESAVRLNRSGNPAASNTNAKSTKFQRPSNKERPFECSVCGLLYTRQWNLTKHYKQNHSGMFKYYRCLALVPPDQDAADGASPTSRPCGVHLESKGNLERHWRLHSNVLSIACNHPGCDQRFQRHEDRNRHHYSFCERRHVCKNFVVTGTTAINVGPRSRICTHTPPSL